MSSIDLLGLFLSFELHQFLVVLVSTSVFHLLFHSLHFYVSVSRLKAEGDLFKNMGPLASPAVFLLSHEVHEWLSGDTDFFFQDCELNQT